MVQKINLAPKKMLVLYSPKNQFGSKKNASPFYVEKQTITYEDKRLCSPVFSTKKTSKYKSAIREAPTVSSRLPRLMAADKPCPQLQPSLMNRTFNF